MPYIYEVTFDIPPAELDELQIGHSLERVLGYLRTLLPNEHGFMTSRAMYSVDDPALTKVVFFSEWGSWDALETHRDSGLLEAKVLTEFGPRVERSGITSRIYAEAGPRDS